MHRIYSSENAKLSLDERNLLEIHNTIVILNYKLFYFKLKK